MTTEHASDATDQTVRTRLAFDAQRRIARRSWLGGLMALSVVLVAALGVWDQNREAEAMLRVAEQQQAALASLVAMTVTARLLALPVQASPSPTGASDDRGRPVLVPSVGTLLQGLDVGADVLVALRPPGETLFQSATGGRFESAPLQESVARSRPSIRLTRPEAAALRLPRRIAIAGFAPVEAGALGRWDVAVVASAASERDREARARWRLLFGVALSGVLVLVFGGFALRAERKELSLLRELTLTELEQRRDEQLEREGRAVTMLTLAAGVAHEISTPLSVIHGRAEQLLDRLRGDPRTAHALQRILDQSSRIDVVVRGFLRFARGDGPTLERIDPAEVTQDAAALVEHRFAKAGVTLTASAPPGLVSVQGDHRLLEHALVNLLLNACDACDPGGQVSFTVGLEAGGAEVRFQVDDDGSGISPDLMARVAEPFFSTKPASQGTGLGLAIAREIVKIHRGTLGLAPRNPRGTSATVRLPVVPGAVDARS